MNFFLSHLNELAQGFWITIVLMLFSVAIGFFLAVIMTCIWYSEVRWAKKTVSALIFFIRGTPLLIQFYLIYFGVGQFAFIRDSFLWTVLREPMPCAIIALSINSACYTAILLQGAIAAVPDNEIAACTAIGMTKWQALRYIIFKRAIGLVLPAYSNEVVMILKGTSLASTITLLDLMGVTQQFIGQTYNTVEWYIIAAVLYLFLHGLITSIFYVLIQKTYYLNKNK